MRGFQFRAVRPPGRSICQLGNFAEFSQTASLCILILLLSAVFSTAGATGKVQLAWDAVPENGLAGYVLYYGTSSGYYTQSIDVGNTVTTTVQNLTVSGTYYFAVAAYDETGLESAPSNEAVYTVSTCSTTGSGSGVSGSSSATAASASFVGSDTSTRGNWKGVYGTDGFSLEGDVTSYPSYAAVTSTGYLTYTWAASTSDVRALQKSASSTDRIAACWYTSTLALGANYTFDVNLTDGNSHQVGIYVVDWDSYNGPRAESVQLTDAVSGAVLDTEAVSSFQAGGYLIWTVRGHVKINVINALPGSNAVASGLFFDPVAATQTGPAGTTTVSSGAAGTTTGSGTRVGGSSSGTTQSTSAATTTGSSSSTGITTGSGSSSTTGSGSGVSGSSSATGASASFVGSDTSTRGNWKGIYGTDGYSLAGDDTSYPAYATVTNAGYLTYTWAASTSDVRALQKSASSTDRIAACWYTSTLALGASYTFDVNLTDGNSHQVGFYVVDWDSYNGPRAETVQLTDAASGVVLDTEAVSSFQAGGYLVWTVRGHIKINLINNLAGSNAVASGLFFDPVAVPQSTTTGTTTASSGTTGITTGSDSSSTTGSGSGVSGSSSATAASASFVGSDTSTRGNWKGIYGTDGYSLAGDDTSYPAYAAVTSTGYLTYTWAASTSDVRALQKSASSTVRIAACWYTSTLASGASYTFDVNLTDGNSHQVGFYVVDWDSYNGPRAETVQLTDAASGAVLDTEAVSSFQAGGYLIWTVRGHVKINVINALPGSNAVASGLFFDPAGTTMFAP